MQVLAQVLVSLLTWRCQVSGDTDYIIHIGRKMKHNSAPQAISRRSAASDAHQGGTGTEPCKGQGPRGGGDPGVCLALLASRTGNQPRLQSTTTQPNHR
jgi:hypothetical protein